MGTTPFHHCLLPQEQIKISFLQRNVTGTRLVFKYRGSTLIDFRKESPLKLWDYAPKRLSSHFMFTFMIMGGLAPSPPRCRMRLLFFLIATYESSKSHVTCQPGPHLSSSAT
ncbi:hypothetical protein MITSMUL_04917 [Mitsuokella multacida DSM 20544]|uniref:Uncharacterized protein n=1 Tax=Mitsuokella multacida DSM 20544 TaxID=500635 RepID=C9KNW3_9FIRM|nr:hypothetical protein MITSMUL_04917 [Mitsuokella multacida DSM 20544]